MSSRSRRTSRKKVFQSIQKRPIDKQIINVTTAAFGQTQAITTIRPGATFPGTITGIRWRLQLQTNAVAANADTVLVTWVLVRLRDGVVASTISQTNASTMYAPEQDVIVCGTIGGKLPLDSIAPEGWNQSWFDEGTTKTMRKLQNGDQIVLIYKSSNTPVNHFLAGFFEFFYKT